MLVVTQPDRPSGRGQKMQPTPVKTAARALGIRAIEPVRLREALDALREVDADLFAVASYGKIVPATVLELPRLGALNVHPSLLPLYRGATPLQSQLRDGVADGGVTIIAMDAGMDTGDVVLRERTVIGPAETYGELHDRCAELGARLLARACGDVVAGRAGRFPQSLFGSEAEASRTSTRPFAKHDLEIDWTATARAVTDRIRSSAPAPGARARFDGDDDPVKILAARVGEPRDLPAVGADELRTFGSRAPGSLAGKLVVTGSGFVVLERVVPAGRGAMTGDDFARSRAARTRLETVNAG